MVGLIQLAAYPINHFPARGALRDLAQHVTGHAPAGPGFVAAETLAFFTATLALALAIDDLGGSMTAAWQSVAPARLRCSQCWAAAAAALLPLLLLCCCCCCSAAAAAAAAVLATLRRPLCPLCLPPQAASSSWSAAPAAPSSFSPCLARC